MKKYNTPFYLICLFIFISFTIKAQTSQKYTVSGFIGEQGSKESLPGVNVYAPKLKVGAVTNNYGFFTLTLPADSIELLVTYVGYKTQSFKLNLNKNIQLDIPLQHSVDLKEVEVSADKLEKISDEVQMSKIDLPVEQIKNLPALLGEKDVLKAIQLLPGVQKGSEGSSGIYVRGGGPDQNLIILDDATVYNATHLFGFFSLFNGDALKSVELTKGGFPARYGGRLSSVIEMQMKDGNKEKIHSEVGIGLISSRFTVEGPIIKDKASFLISARRTYIDVLTLPLQRKELKFGYYFYDFNAKLNYILDYKNKLYLSGYFGKDKFYIKSENGDYKSDAALRWGNATGTLRWNHLVNEKIFSNVSLIFTDFLFDIKDDETYSGGFYSLKYYSGIRDYSIKTDVDYSPNPKHFIKGGILATYHYFRPSALVTKSSFETDNSSRKTNIDAYETAIYVEDDFKISEKWRTNTGIRLSNFNVRGKSYFNPEPRIALRYLIKPDLSLKVSYASMNQYLHLLSNSGIGLPTDLWVPATNRIKPQQSQQVALGLAKDLKIKEAAFMVSLEGYYKKSRNIIGYKEGASFLDTDPTQSNSSFSYEDIVTAGNAESYGAEFFFQKKFGKLTGWIGYTLSWTWLKFNELNFGNRFPARYDRRHDLSVVGIYKLSDHITLSATWVYGTGNAISLPLSSYQAGIQDPHPTTNLFGNNTTTVNEYGDKNSFRMAPYHRFDIAIQFHRNKSTCSCDDDALEIIKKIRKFERTFELGLYNAYNRHNPFYYYTQFDYNSKQTKLKQVSLFPIIPSISWTWKF
ncbi:MAG: TonB-dependent receptor [Bacteroidota bacterium]